jgi:DHA1 family multidrug resistance protein-like MFS transporter
MLVNPVWGLLADRYGLKSMVVRAMLGGTLTLTLMGFSTQAWQLFGARVLQGLVGGSSPAMLTLAALTLPHPRLGTGMGLMQTAQFLGNSLGPLMGTVTVGIIGYRGTFLAAAGVMAALIVLTLVFVKEPPRVPVANPAAELGFMQRLAFVGRAPRLRGVIIATLLFQFSYTTGITLLPLHMYAITGGEQAARAVGIVLTGSALGGALGGVVVGSLAGRFGAARVAVVAFLLSAVLLPPQVLLTSPEQFAVARFFTDFCAGGILPALRTLLADEAARHEATASSLGAVYGLSQSAYSGGQAIGAAVCAAVAAIWGIPSTFVVAAVLAAGTGLGWRWIVGSGSTTPQSAR